MKRPMRTIKSGYIAAVLLAGFREPFDLLTKLVLDDEPIFSK